jgi:pimeloyl-ACP methyl ester carboxylesterase
VLPGFGAGDGSTMLLRGYLRSLGYAVRGWGLGRNGGNVATLIPRVMEVVAGYAERHGQSVRLVGWSLGGNLAREVARERPDIVDQVITLGTPAVGGPKYTAVAEQYRRRGYDLDTIEAEVANRERTPIRVPVTAIYSRSDAIVTWQACLDRISPSVEHVEVATTHLGLGLSPEVYRIIADRLVATATGRPAQTATG